MNRLEREQTPWSGAAAPDSRYLGADNVADLLRDCAQMGLMDELRAALGGHGKPDQRTALQAVRDLVYELAGAKDRDLV